MKFICKAGHYKMGNYKPHHTRLLFSLNWSKRCLLLSTHTQCLHQLLEFSWKGQLFKFLVLRNGLCNGTRKFTKLMKLPAIILRMEGHIFAICIDDLINVSHKFDECSKNIDACIKLLQYLGFTIHPTKYVFEPKQTLMIWDFV